MRYTIKNINILLTLAIGLFYVQLIPVPTYADSTDTYIKKQLIHKHIAGLSLVVIENGDVVKATGYGYADVSHHIPSSKDTVYELASNTKQFLAAAIVLLQQDGKLGFDDRISKYIAHTPDSWKTITIRELLTHTSGIPDYLVDVLNDDSSVPGPDTNPVGIMAMVSSLPLKFVPGQRSSYSNTNYVLLGIIIHDVTGMTFDKYLQQKIFKPLHMKCTGLDDPSSNISNRASGYSWINGHWLKCAALNPTTWNNGDGGLRSSVSDMAKWEISLERADILTRRSESIMWHPQILSDGTTSNRGFGWSVFSLNGHRCIGHNGSRLGSASSICRFPDDKITVIVLDNTDVGGGLQQIAQHVAWLYIPALAPLHPITDTQPGSTQIIREIMKSLQYGKQLGQILPGGVSMGASGFSDKLNSPNDLALAIQKLGAYNTFNVTARTKSDQGESDTYVVEYKYDTLVIVTNFDVNGHQERIFFQLE